MDIEYILKLAKEFEHKTRNQYVYHIKSSNFKGRYIYPLAQLKDEYPDIYKKELKKYKGRETHPDTKIDCLKATWKDCVNFSTINPIKIFQLIELLGLPGDSDVEIFQFNINDLPNSKMCLYDDNKSPKNSESYKRVSAKSYRETRFVPPETVKYFAQSKEKDEHPLIFGNVSHLLVADKVSTDKAEIIKFKDIIYR